jgi:hypothetical protein
MGSGQQSADLKHFGIRPHSEELYELLPPGYVRRRMCGWIYGKYTKVYVYMYHGEN